MKQHLVRRTVTDGLCVEFYCLKVAKNTERDKYTDKTQPLCKQCEHAQKQQATRYEVIVGNVGRIYEGHKEHEAMHHYKDAVARSKANIGRMSGEPVCLMRDGEPTQEYHGTNVSPDESTS